MTNLLNHQPKRGASLQGALAALLLAAAGTAPAANVTVDLCATSGSVSLPAAPAAVTVLGYARGACATAAALTVPGGPVIDVNVGDVVTVNLQNKLAAATAMLFQGQTMVPDRTGAPAAAGTTYGSKTYTFTATRPGTYLYEAALLPNTEYQAAMGLHGALIVRPAPVAFTGLTLTAAGGSRTDASAAYTSGSTTVADTAAVAADVGATVSGAGIAAGTTVTAVDPGASFTMSAPAGAAYGASTVYNDEAVLLLSEIDPVLNNSPAPAAFDMRDFAPRYFLINGQAYPNTAPITSAPGNTLLLRYVNGGVKHHSMGVLGLRQVFIAKDAGLLPTLNHNVVAETLAPGQTGDALVAVPALASASSFALYDASLALHNNGVDTAYGGMLTFVKAGAGAVAAGPSARAVALTPNPANGSAAVALSATLASTTSTVAAAEYFVDATGAAGSGTAMGGTFGTASVAASASLSTAQLAALAAGAHTVYVHGKDATGKWGAFASAVLNLDKAGPVTGGLTLTPNPSNGTVGVALKATANDSSTGNSFIAGAEYSVDGGTPVAMTLNTTAAPVASASATVPAGLAAGAHTVSVRSRDALGNWGAPATITLNVVAAGPVTSAVSASPNPNNGTVPFSVTQQVVRVVATLNSTGSTVAGAEGFIDAVGAPGTGFALVPTDGAWNAASEQAYADIPLATVKGLSSGSHTLYVRGKDAVGSWGGTATTVLVVDKVVPTATVALSPATVVYGPGGSTQLTVTGADVGGTGVARGQYWVDGTATPPASPTAFTGTGTTASVATGALGVGTHTVYARVQDAAGNWSTVANATFTVAPNAVTDAKTVTVNNSQSQVAAYAAGSGLLVNDLPGGAGRTVVLASAPVRTAGTGTGTVAVSCPAGSGTAATPAVSGSTVCTNGAFAVTLTAPVTATTNAARRTAKQGTYRFTYIETLNGVQSAPATVTITVN